MKFPEVPSAPIFIGAAHPHICRNNNLNVSPKVQRTGIFVEKIAPMNPGGAAHQNIPFFYYICPFIHLDKI